MAVERASISMRVPQRRAKPLSQKAGTSQRGSRKRRARRTFQAFALPATVLFAIFVLYPIGKSIYLSFFDSAGIGHDKFVGLANFRTFLSSTQFTEALLHSVLICAATTVLSTLIGIIVAGGVHIGVPGSALFRLACFVPFIIPLAISATFWNTAFQPTGGLVNNALGLVGLGDSHLWIGDPKTAIYPVIFVATWIQSGFSMLLILAAMEDISPEIDEAALIDGAGVFALFWQVTLPLVRRVILLSTLLQLIFSFRLFTVVYTLTKGGPGDATQIFPTLVYRQAFDFNQFGYASAIAVVSTVIVLAIIAVFIAVFRPFRSEA